ncbi:MAG TPA: FAD-dependent oxidoreductase [Gemmatimonadales bacterium]|nr:FAD-dependent oxidoreductase [Gemmatimonadales bacterium]
MTPHVAVVGAGAFGGWTALHLRRAGARVTLLDAWGAGNSRASSGGETRVIRGIYGGERRYVELTLRSLALWREAERRWGRRLYRCTGAVWMFHGDDAYARTTLPLLRAAGLPAVELTVAEAASRYPQIDFSGVRSVFVEAEAGYLLARQACEAVREALVAEGGEYRTAAAEPARPAKGGLGSLRLADGSALHADRFVFACGPWLGAILPDVVGERVRATRQEVFFFGLPRGDTRYDEGTMPVWVDHGARFMYGIPGNERRGFKVADDTRGPVIDPTTEERLPTADALARARALLRTRFPGLADAPLVEARVCQYEQTPDGHPILDRHPDADNVWIAGGGSGHGFKMGPAVGEQVARLVLGDGAPDPFFSLGRFGQ